MNKDAFILITGSNGMVGHAISAKLRAAGYSRLLTPSSKRLDLRDGLAVDDYFHHNPIEYVFHCAGRVGGIAANTADPYRFLRDNLLMGCNIVDTCRGFKVKRIVNLGSSCMYPRECAQPMTEDKLLTGALEPTNEGYALAKLCAQRLCKYAGPNFVTLVPCNLYGPYDHFGKTSSHVIPALIARFVLARDHKSEEVLVWGTGKARREFLYVEDVADAMLHFMLHDEMLPAAINIGLGSDLTIEELTRHVAEAVGYKGKIVFDNAAPDGMPQKLVDISRARTLGWQPKVTLLEGLRRTVEWYEINRHAQANS